MTRMAKFTAKFVREGLRDFVSVQTFDALTVKGDKEATFNNVAMQVLAGARAIDTAYVFEAKFPEGIADLMDEYTSAWEELRAQLAKEFPKEYKVFAK